MQDKLATVQPMGIERDPMREWETMKQQAIALVASRLLPRAVDTPEKAIAIIQTGRELGIGPMQALRSINVIDGKPCMSAELMAGLVFARVPGVVLRVKTTSNDECTVEAARPGQPLTPFSFSMADARAAGLTGKDNWKKYPAAMLRARCLAGASRAIAPDATMGMLTPDELGAVTTETGEIATYEASPGGASPHGERTDYPQMEAVPEQVDAALYDSIIARIATVRNGLDGCTTYQQALTLRALLGSKAKPQEAELSRDFQRAREQKLVSFDGLKEISKRWNHCDRKLGELEKELAPSAEASFADVDEADPAEEFSRE